MKLNGFMGEMAGLTDKLRSLFSDELFFDAELKAHDKRLTEAYSSCNSVIHVFFGSQKLCSKLKPGETRGQAAREGLEAMNSLPSDRALPAKLQMALKSATADDD